MNTTQPQIYASAEQLQEATADAFCNLARSAIEKSGSFRVALSGGSTPKRLHEILVTRDCPWNKMHFFWGDERNVPLDHANSNYRMACETLLDHVPVPDENVHPVPVDLNDPATAARKYELTLRENFIGDAFPNWDLVLLGMGDDAHTASLFPETKALSESGRWFVDNWVEKLDTYRYTLTPPAINSGNEIWFLIAGKAKRAALKHVLSSEIDPQRYPSQLIRPSRLFVTRDAMPQ